MTLAPDRRTRWLGSPLPNLEWRQKTDGSALFADDIKPARLLHAAVLRSPHAHARIRGIDVSAVLASPGVVAVVTAADLPGHHYIHHGHHLADRTVLAGEKVRYIGEEVAGVAAETPEQARAALARFRMDYERLPAVTDLEQARRPGAPLVHDTCAGNVALAFDSDFGAAPDPATVAASVTGRYVFPRQNHACMETNSIVASWDAEARELHVWVSTQAPYFVRKELAHVLDLPRESIVVHEVAVGGGFGSKSKISEYEAVAALLTLKSGRPVRLALTRDEEFETTKSRHRFEIEMTTAADADGRLLSRTADVVVDNGAFNHSGPSVMGAGTGAMASLYDVPHVAFQANLIYTNTLPGGQFRGYGNPQATFAVETQVDEVAQRLGMDPFELRIRNANRAGQRTHVGYDLRSAALVECLEAAREAIGWPEKRGLAGSGRGVGVACAIQVSGANVYPGADRSSARLVIDVRGGVELQFGGADAGTGQRTMLAQVVAHELELPLRSIDVTMMDSVRTPRDMGAWSTRGTYMSAHATREACRLAVQALRDRAAGLYGVAAEAIVVRDGALDVAGVQVGLEELMDRTAALGPLVIEHEYTADVEPMDWASGTGNISGAYSFAAHAVEVEVDRDTGRVRVLDYVAAHDSGVVLNPLLADSQVIGGVAMGLGVALGEELILEEGRMVNGAYVDYPLPRAADVPRIRPLFVAGDDPNAPYGAKGIGEVVMVPTVAAVGNAIAHATGARLREAPFTPDRVLPAWREVTGAPSRSYHIWRRPSRWQIAAIRSAYPRGLHRALDRFGTRWAKVQEATPVTEIVRPADESAALAALAAPGSRPVGGGTDLVPGQRRGKQALGTLVDVTLIPGMGRVRTAEDVVRIGGAVRLATLADVEGTDWSGVLGATVRGIAGPQVREMATVAGNLCQEKRCWFYRNDFTCYKRGGATCPCYAVEGDHRFYHAVAGAHRCQAVTPSDLATTLLALDARVVVKGPRGTRTLAVSDLYSGPGETTLRDGELIVEVEVPRREAMAYAFEKLDLYTGDFAVVSAAVAIERAPNGGVRDARLVLGAVAPVPLRLERLERRLVEAGAPRSMDEVRSLAAQWGSMAHPLRDNEWKVDAAAGVLAQALGRALDVEGGSGGRER
jgi:CO/xanthine dehydrogenase Mo-binding subunit/CO/xanthine dehydrogenase FAD-binding subunit